MQTNQKYRDYTGSVFGRLTVLSMVKRAYSKNSYCLCKCECGNEKEIRLDALKNGSVKSCGCLKKPDYTGKKFGHLIVLKMVYIKNEKHSYCLCKCDCGKTNIIRTDGLLDNRVSSCGCITKDLIRNAVTTHGQSYNRIYKVYKDMIQRCTNSNSKGYNCYGGKGIKYSSDFDTFEKFYEWSMNNGYNDKCDIHRLDSNQDYTPKNCVWIPHNEHMKLHGNMRRKKVIAINPETNQIEKRFDSVTDAVKSCGNCVQRALKDPNLIRYGYKWQYVE